MSNITALKLKNLRCFKNTGFVNIKPITVLVGRNSAGKSTFARIFPLLRQSAEQEKRSPILWYGRFVDFGSFNAALNKNATEKTITISFKFSLEKTIQNRRFMGHIGFMSRTINSDNTEIEIELNLSFDEASNSTFASSIVLKLFDRECTVVFGDSKTVKEIRINDFSWIPNEPYSCIVTQKNILPSISYYRSVRRKVDDKEFTQKVKSSPFMNQLYSHLRRGFHPNTTAEKIFEVASTLRIGSKSNIIQFLSKSATLTTTTKRNFSRLIRNFNYVDELSNYLFADSLPEILELVDQNLGEVVEGVRYIEPLRATAQRYYRGQDLAVDEIDSKGTNVAMYIESLTASENTRLNTWLKEHFNVQVFAKNEGGHIAITLQEESSMNATNIADLGVGFSQILPIALQLWQASNPSTTKRKIRNTSQNTSIIIEQPELHLHPAFQAKIANVMQATLEAVNLDEDKSIQIIVETHSSQLINRLGELISEGKLKSEDVQVILFEESAESKEAEVRVATFDDDGYLLNWPYGFFEP